MKQKALGSLGGALGGGALGGAADFDLPSPPQPPAGQSMGLPIPGSPL